MAEEAGEVDGRPPSRFRPPIIPHKAALRHFPSLSLGHNDDGHYADDQDGNHHAGDNEEIIMLVTSHDGDHHSPHSPSVQCIMIHDASTEL